jgi:hypothetical protein
MARMNSIGEMGSPWQSPLSYLSGLTGAPLRRILDDEVERARLI